MAQTAQPHEEKIPEIVGGTEAAPGAWPWQVALVRADEPDAYKGQFCGGTLVAATWVLTAAHCVNDQNANEIDVVLGRHKLSSSDGERIGVAEILIHPVYVSWRLGSDLALLRLSQGSAQSTVLVDANKDVPAEARALRAAVTGWGATEDRWYGSDVLREVSVPLVTRDVCNAPEAYAGRVTSDMLCAGYLKGGKGACYGDSGGPLLIPSPQGTAWMQVGIVSWGPAGCNREEGYSVFTRVASFEQWIQACLINVNSPACSGSDKYEPDNEAGRAMQIAVGGSVQNHNFHRADDVDWLKFNAKQSTTYLIETVNLGLKTDTILWLFESNGATAITYNDDDGNDYRASRIVWTAPRDDTFFIEVENYHDTTGAEARYGLKVVELNQHIYLPIVAR
jgi:hypothetical protein